VSLEVGAACSTKGRLAVSTQWCLATLAFLPCPLTSCASHSTPSGASVAINGTCLTVTEQRGPVLRFDVMAETLRRTNLGALDVGTPVNFERRWGGTGGVWSLLLAIPSSCGTHPVIFWGNAQLPHHTCTAVAPLPTQPTMPPSPCRPAARVWAMRLAGTRCLATCTPPPRSSR